MKNVSIKDVEDRVGFRIRNKINNINVRRRGSYSVTGRVIFSRDKITTVVILSRDRITTVVILSWTMRDRITTIVTELFYHVTPVLILSNCH